MWHLSGSQWIIYGALSVLWAVLGYRLSENDRKALGRTPWGLPSALWAFFWFLSLLLGLVLYLIAHSIGVRQAQQNPPIPGSPMAGPPPSTKVSSRGSASASDLFPASPRPANSQPSNDPDPIQTEEPSDPQVLPGPTGDDKQAIIQPARRSQPTNSPSTPRLPILRSTLITT